MIAPSVTPAAWVKARAPDAAGRVGRRSAIPCSGGSEAWTPGAPAQRAAGTRRRKTAPIPSLQAGAPSAAACPGGLGRRRVTLLAVARTHTHRRAGVGGRQRQDGGRGGGSAGDSGVGGIQRGGDLQ